MVCNLTKSRKGGVGKGGLLEGEPRKDQKAWDTYQKWIMTGVMGALLVVGLTFLLSGNFPVIRPSRIWPVAMIGIGLMLGAWALASALNRTRPEPRTEANLDASTDPAAEKAAPPPGEDA